MKIWMHFKGNARMSLRLAIGALFLIPVGLYAQKNGQTTDSEALQLSPQQSDEVRIDGILSESFWQQATIATGFRQKEPDEGAAATERTEVRVVYDDNVLYIGVMAYDNEPEKIISRILERDRVMGRSAFNGNPAFSGDDGIAILLDPFHDHRNAVVFATNANGAEFDALISDEGKVFNVDWRAIWRVEAKRVPQGWSAEFAIPFRTLRYPSGAGDEPWGFNVFRSIRRKNEDVLWSAWSRDNEGFARVSKAGHLYGMRDLPRPGMNLEVKPFMLSSGAEQVDEFSKKISDGKFEAGLDAKWEVRPGMLLDLTLNTDFVQVEADDQQINLTRFNLFFPEKRDFFLENAGIFEFGSRGFGGPPPFILFFSRNIGIAGSHEVPVIGGARLTGKMGRQSLGFLNIVTDDFSNADVSAARTNFSVARIKRDIGNNNNVGLIATDRRTRDTANSTLGLDWSFWLTKRLNFTGYAAQMFTKGEGGDDGAYQVSFDYTADKWGFFNEFVSIGPDARADLGFITRTGIRKFQQTFRVSPRPKVFGLRMINIFMRGDRYTTTDGEIQDWSYGPNITFNWNSGESLGLSFSDGFTRLNDGFDLAGRVPVPAGDYDDRSVRVTFSTSSNRKFAFSSGVSRDKTFGGTLTNFNAGADVAMNAHLAFGLSYSHNRVELPNGEFNADIGRLRLSYAFSTRLFLNTLMQYNRLENTISTNFRLNYIHSPGSDIYLVINDNRGDTPGSVWDLDNRGIILKVTYLRRL